MSERLAALERACADLRVRGVLEQQVAALAASKGDAAVFTAQLGMLRGELTGVLEATRQEERREMNETVARMTQRQDQVKQARFLSLFLSLFL